MAAPPQARGGPIAGSAAAVESDSEAGPAPAAVAGPFPPLPEAQPEYSVDQADGVDARVEEIRRLYGTNAALFSRFEDRMRRGLGLAPLGAGAATLAGLMGIAIRLGPALVATGLAGQWTDVPWGRWAVILLFYGLFDATQPRRTPPLDAEVSPRLRRWGENMTPLIPTIVRESDLQDLTDFMRRWLRLPVIALVGVAVAAIMLGAGRLFAPVGMDQVPAGSVVLLAFLLFDFGSLMVFGDLFESAFMTRQARYEHRLFWLSPADSPEVRKAMQMWNVRALALWITVYLVLTVILVSWDSPVVVPLAVGFIVIGYLSTIGTAIGDRSAVRRIVVRARDQQLDMLQWRIEPFRSTYTQLTPQESQHLRRLVDLHTVIRDAPTTSPGHSVVRAAAGLLVPTIVFVITVFGEVSAERILDSILP